LPASTPHPFQEGPPSSAPIGLAAHRFGIADACPANAAPRGRSVMNSAIIFFCASVRPSALTLIDPVVKASNTASGVR
jgi:hypothetical protein